ncbi:MAG: hypothetical protein AMQ22_02264 [Candidatus Methanofastidiosum methylothiophilum]|uniref:Uncharacterized protein n=1 Tax=Candidatus Methanofastidiosum methylothiophilum TaxID=1705564 RepID=A0A150IIJ7_9EURY|nr:MAG: hypothetical protein AMQ22_02264 [Candidatus Methanofastidiosum methylthiophilus]
MGILIALGAGIAGGMIGNNFFNNATKPQGQQQNNLFDFSNIWMWVAIGLGVFVIMGILKKKKD